MRYAILLYVDADLEVGPDGAEWRASLDGHMRLGKRLEERGYDYTGGALHGVASATTLRKVDGSVMTIDGPFAETKEQLWGYYNVEAPDLDAVMSLVEGMWETENGAIEIRPLIPVMAPAG